jgi:hypothetical protein
MTSEPLKEMYKTPLAQVRGVFLCDNVADTIHSPVRSVDVTPWTDVGETTEAEGGNVFLAM